MKFSPDYSFTERKPRYPGEMNGLTEHFLSYNLLWRGHPITPNNHKYHMAYDFPYEWLSFSDVCLHILQSPKIPAHPRLYLLNHLAGDTNEKNSSWKLRWSFSFFKVWGKGYVIEGRSRNLKRVAVWVKKGPRLGLLFFWSHHIYYQESGGQCQCVTLQTGFNATLSVAGAFESLLGGGAAAWSLIKGRLE